MISPKLVGSAIVLIIAVNASAMEANLMPNGRLDADQQITGWDIYFSPQPPGIQLSWSDDDAGSDPGSGSVQVDADSGYGEGAPACFEVAPNATYSFGGQSKSVGPNAALAYEYCSAYTDTYCYLGKTALAQAPMSAVAAWISSAPSSGMLPAAARSVRCEFVIFSQGDNATAISVRFDNLFFISSVPLIFQDGFEEASPVKPKGGD